MGDWQRFNGYEADWCSDNGLQRKSLMDDYNEPLISVGMERYC